MKKIFMLLSILMSLAFAAESFASNPTATTIQLKDTSRTAISSYALTSEVAVNSDSIYVKDNIGFMTLILSVDASGDVDVYAEYADDPDGTWSKAYICDMTGTCTVEGNIITASTNVTSRRYVFTPRMGEYVRIVFDPDANSTITAKLTYQKGR